MCGKSPLTLKRNSDLSGSAVTSSRPCTAPCGRLEQSAQSGSFAVFDTTKAGNRIVGRVAGIGLTDEINDRHYVVVDGIDGRVHYADVGHQRPEFVPEKGMIVAIENQTSEDDAKIRTRLRILSYLNLERLTEAEGATWLDKELLTAKPEQ